MLADTSILTDLREEVNEELKHQVVILGQFLQHHLFEGGEAVTATQPYGWWRGYYKWGAHGDEWVVLSVKLINYGYMVIHLHGVVVRLPSYESMGLGSILD